MFGQSFGLHQPSHIHFSLSYFFKSPQPALWSRWKYFDRLKIDGSKMSLFIIIIDLMKHLTYLIKLKCIKMKIIVWDMDHGLYVNCLADIFNISIVRTYVRLTKWLNSISKKNKRFCYFERRSRSLKYIQLSKIKKKYFKWGVLDRLGTISSKLSLNIKVNLKHLPRLVTAPNIYTIVKTQMFTVQRIVHVISEIYGFMISVKKKKIFNF